MLHRLAGPTVRSSLSRGLAARPCGPRVSRFSSAVAKLHPQHQSELPISVWHRICTNLSLPLQLRSRNVFQRLIQLCGAKKKSDIPGKFMCLVNLSTMHVLM